MSVETLTAATTIDASPEAVFEVLAAPSTHAAIDGTGRVREARDVGPVREVGQVFRMGMFHANHPDGHYEMANRVEVFDPPWAICWRPGQDDGSGELQFGGWLWRYDLASAGGSGTEVTLTFDWSAVPAHIREYISFPPFGVEHLENSLNHLAALTAQGKVPTRGSSAGTRSCSTSERALSRRQHPEPLHGPWELPAADSGRRHRSLASARPRSGYEEERSWTWHR